MGLTYFDHFIDLLNSVFKFIEKMYYIGLKIEQIICQLNLIK